MIGTALEAVKNYRESRPDSVGVPTSCLASVSGYEPGDISGFIWIRNRRITTAVFMPQLYTTLGSLARPDKMSMQSHLQAIGLVQYTQTLQGHGFETWQDLIGIIESDFEQMGMLRGHRRKLQRALHLSLASENGTCSSITSTYKE